MFRSTAVAVLLLACQGEGFSPCRQQLQQQISSPRSGGSTATRLYSTETNHLPPELAKITEAFKSVGDDSLRHKQLLYMANQLPLIAPDKMIPENKVPGCLSTVYIDGSARWSEEKGDFLIDYVGESDGLLTKGLVALLVR